MAKSKEVWYNPFTWGKTEPEIMTKDIQDPTKTGVASKYSQYLEGRIGKGLPSYPGRKFEDIYGGYGEFLDKPAGEWFEEAVAGPETKRFKEEFFPLITEGYAGALRGSGRFRAEEAGIGQFTEALSQQRAQAIPEITERQFGMASQIYERERSEWMQSLPEYNPVLGQALDFLKGPTGKDTFAGLDPGQKGWFVDAAKIVADLVDAFMPDTVAAVAVG